MDYPTPFQGKPQNLSSKCTKKDSDAPKATKPKGLSTQRAKRVFGRVINQNIQANPNTEKTVRKPSSAVAIKTTTSTTATATKTSSKPTTDFNALPETEMTQKTPEESNLKPKKKSVSFSETKDKIIQDGEAAAEITPRRSGSVVKQRVSGTPYRSVGRCSKFRVDKFETSSYWLTQINMAESVGKHFISAASFRLAFLAKAEPFCNIRVELKRYLAHHEDLSTEKEWKDMCIDYELVKKGDGDEEKETGEMKEEEQVVEVHGEEHVTTEQVHGLVEDFEIIVVE